MDGGRIRMTRGLPKLLVEPRKPQQFFYSMMLDTMVNKANSTS